jgi:hypothetical protein
MACITTACATSPVRDGDFEVGIEALFPSSYPNLVAGGYPVGLSSRVPFPITRRKILVAQRRRLVWGRASAGLFFWALKSSGQGRRRDSPCYRVFSLALRPILRGYRALGRGGGLLAPSAPPSVRWLASEASPSSSSVLTFLIHPSYSDDMEIGWKHHATCRLSPFSGAAGRERAARCRAASHRVTEDQFGRPPGLPWPFGPALAVAHPS